jgi:hypothetical protein
MAVTVTAEKATVAAAVEATPTTMGTVAARVAVATSPAAAARPVAKRHWSKY